MNRFSFNANIIASFILLSLIIVLLFTEIPFANAQTTSDCVVTEVGNPSAEASPPDCAGESKKDDTPVPAPSGDFVYYCQGNPRWANTCELGNSGCGPTSVAMIISTMSKPITPPEVDAEFHKLGGRSCSTAGSVISPNVIDSQWFKDFGLKAGDDIGGILNDQSQKSLEIIKEFVDSGQLILASSDSYPCPCGNPDSGPSAWPLASHIVVIQNIDISRKTLTIRDPSNCSYQTGEEGMNNINVPMNSVPWKWAFPIQKT